MANVNLRVNDTTPTRLPAGPGGETRWMQVFEIDCAVTNLSSSNVYQVWDIPARTVIESVALEVLTAEAAADTLKIGDDDNDDGFIEAVTCGTVALTVDTGDYVDAAATKGKLYTAARIMSVTPSAAITKAKFRIYVQASQLPAAS